MTDMILKLGWAPCYIFVVVPPGHHSNIDAACPHVSVWKAVGSGQNSESGSKTTVVQLLLTAVPVA